jgi:cytochrome c biogenesis protein CcdA
MLALLGAVVAGALTTLAPCVLPLLPVIVGGSVVGPGGQPSARSPFRRALVITAALAASITVFTLALKATTAFIGISPRVWSIVSGGILIVLGIVSAFPDVWERLSSRLSLQSRSGTRLSAARRRSGLTGEVLTGAALGPIFSSCSPLYAYVVVTVLPASFGYGLVLLLAYVAGLSATLLAIALAGQRLVRRLGWLADSHGWVRRGLGVVFIVVGISVAFGWDRVFQAWVLEHSPIAPWNLDSGFIPQ